MSYCNTGLGKKNKIIGLNLKEYTENPQEQKLVWIAIKSIKTKKFQPCSRNNWNKFKSSKQKKEKQTRNTERKLKRDYLV